MPNDRTASNYSGKSGKTNVIMQGHTESVYGSTIELTRREPCPPKELKP